jgi:hypothetical protein
MADLRSWLEDLNLAGHYETLIENKIDSDVLPELTESDLEKLQIPLGDRKRLLKAIRALPEETQSEAPAIRGLGGQLRHLTMMFVDLVDSTALSEKLDLEDYGEAITSYQLCCTNIIRDNHGFVTRYLVVPI